MNEDVGGDNLVLAETGEVNGANCTEVTTNLIPVCVEEGRQLSGISYS